MTCQERGLGELYIDGDQACARGDLCALALVAEHLLEHVAEPRHCELLPLARQCSDPERATRAWMQLKREIADGVVP